MEKYLSNLLELNSRVIVPDLGAFIIRQQDPKELVFNDLLAFDDGMLTDTITREENISKTEAQNRIRQFVENVKKELQDGKTYHIEKLGSLKMDATSKINLVSMEEPEVEQAEPASAPPDAGAEDVSEPIIKPTKKPKKIATKADTREKAEAEAKPKPEKPAATEKPVVEKAEVKKEPKTEAKPKPEKPPKEEPAETVAEVKKEPEKKPKPTVEGESRDEGDEGGFILAAVDSEVEVDATREEAPLEPDKEEPPFQIEEDKKDESEEAIASERSIDEAIADVETTADVEAPADDETIADDETLEDEVLAAGSSEIDAITEEEIIKKQEEQYTVKVDGVPVSLDSDEDPFKAYARPVPRKRRTWLWIPATVLLIAIILVAAWFLFPDAMNRFLPESISQRLNQDETALIEPGGGLTDETQLEADDTEQPVSEEETDEFTEETSEPSAEPGGIAEELTEQDEVPEESPRETRTTEPTVKKYYVVAGSFADIRNAENYVRILRDQGYNASIFGKRNNLHSVCFSEHTSRQAASEELARIRASYDPNAWLLYY
jgi:cell division septation protein DedD